MLLFYTIFRHLNCFVWAVVTDGKDWHGLNLEKLEPTFSSFNALPAKLTKKLLLLILSYEIRHILLKPYGSILCMCKGTMQWLQHRNDLKQQYHRDIAPLKFTAVSCVRYYHYARFSLTNFSLSANDNKNHEDWGGVIWEMFAVNLRLTSIATITGEWFHYKVLNILTSFLWSIKLKITENY